MGLKKILLTCQREYVLNLVAQNYELKIKTADKVSIHPTRRCKRDDALHYFVNAYQNYSNRIQPDAKKYILFSYGVGSYMPGKYLVEDRNRKPQYNNFFKWYANTIFSMKHHIQEFFNMLANTQSIVYLQNYNPNNKKSFKFHTVIMFSRKNHF